MAFVQCVRFWVGQKVLVVDDYGEGFEEAEIIWIDEDQGKFLLQSGNREWSKTIDDLKILFDND